LNTLSHAGRSSSSGLKPAIMLRIVENARDSPKFRYDNNHKHYHGGDLVDDVAALTSFILGVRVFGGSLRREFNHYTGPLGNPMEYNSKVRPSLDIDYTLLRIPRATTGIDLRVLSAIDRIALLPVHDTTALIKAARLYQQSLLLCESIPEMSWLLMVSAIETLASNRGLKDFSPVNMFRDAHTSIADRLRRFPLFEAHLANSFAPLLKSTAKFKGFLREFCPPAPTKRPPLFVCSSFEKEKFEIDIGKIYRYRSKHLHEGIAFPGPMCDAPRYWSGPENPDECYSEKPMDGGANYGGASWGSGSCPMLLCHFEYIARGSIINWWKSLDAQITVDVDSRSVAKPAFH